MMKSETRNPKSERNPKPEIRKDSCTEITEETVGWATDALIGFPLPFGRGEGQGEGSHENFSAGRSFPLTLSAGERENRTTATLFCRPCHRLLTNRSVFGIRISFGFRISDFGFVPPQ